MITILSELIIFLLLRYILKDETIFDRFYLLHGSLTWVIAWLIHFVLAKHVWIGSLWMSITQQDIQYTWGKFYANTIYGDFKKREVMLGWEARYVGYYIACKCCWCKNGPQLEALACPFYFRPGIDMTQVYFIGLFNNSSLGSLKILLNLWLYSR